MAGRSIVYAAALLLLGARAWGAELFYMDHDPFTDEYIGPIGPLVVSGEIMNGDYERLLAKIMGEENRFLSLNKIILASDGGDVAEAMKIANLVNSLFTEIVVGPRTGRCVSACFLIFAAANQRATEGEHLIGINRLYFADPAAPSLAAADVESAESSSRGIVPGALPWNRKYMRASGQSRT